MTRLAVILTALLLLALPARAATEVVEVTSPGGLTAWLVEEPSIPMLALEAVFEGGASLDPAEKAGATHLMMGLMSEGAGDLDALAFSGRAQDLALRLGWESGRDSVSVSAAMLTENRDASVELLALALNAPSFAPEAIDRVRAQALSGLRSDQTDPDVLARDAFNDAAFPAGHPYARAPDGSVETVTALTRDDIAAARRRAFARDRLTIAAVGDITPEELGPLIDRLFGDLPAEGPPLPEMAEVAEADETLVIPFASPQAVARFGHGGLQRDDPDYLAAYVLNQILGGGGFGSRLTEELREKRGLTYGVYTTLSPARYGPLYLGSVSSANETIAEAVELVRAEWARIAAEGISAEELAAAKRYLTGAYPLRFDGNGRIAGILVGLQLAGLPISYVKERNALVEALTLEDINRVAARIYKPEALRVVVVGQPEGLETSD